jgi:hypothetical protein
MYTHTHIRTPTLINSPGMQLGNRDTVESDHTRTTHSLWQQDWIQVSLSISLYRSTRQVQYRNGQCSMYGSIGISLCFSCSRCFLKGGLQVNYMHQHCSAAVISSTELCADRGWGWGQGASNGVPTRNSFPFSLSLPCQGQGWCLGVPYSEQLAAGPAHLPAGILFHPPHVQQAVRNMESVFSS